MKIIYLREKRSGNFEFSNRENHTHKFNTWTGLEAWYNQDRKLDSLYSGRTGQVIKAEYRKSQTYFDSFAELKTFIKKSKS